MIRRLLGYDDEAVVRELSEFDERLMEAERRQAEQDTYLSRLERKVGISQAGGSDAAKR